MSSAGCPIILPRENESVLLGAAVLGAVAGKKFPGVRDAMKALNAVGKVFPIIFLQLGSLLLKCSLNMHKFLTWIFFLWLLVMT